eukprot:8644828-Pyramimonas_sp.AAC.1
MSRTFAFCAQEERPSRGPPFAILCDLLGLFWKAYTEACGAVQQDQQDRQWILEFSKAIKHGQLYHGQTQ